MSKNDKKDKKAKSDKEKVSKKDRDKTKGIYGPYVLLEVQFASQENLY